MVATKAPPSKEESILIILFLTGQSGVKIPGVPSKSQIAYWVRHIEFYVSLDLLFLLLTERWFGESGQNPLYNTQIKWVLERRVSTPLSGWDGLKVEISWSFNNAYSGFNTPLRLRRVESFIALTPAWRRPFVSTPLSGWDGLKVFRLSRYRRIFYCFNTPLRLRRVERIRLR